ncbi:hypothetical protein ACN47E_008479 [Coniothyrium glycines]
MDMDMDAPQHAFDWANDAYLALNDPDIKQQPPHQQQLNNWAFSGPSSSQSTAFTIPPALLSRAAIERYGQVTPPEELSPAEPRRDARENSIPVEQLRNETFCPDHPPTTEQHFTPPYDHDEQHQDPSPKRRRTSKQAPANQNPATNASQLDTTEVNPQPPKRKRGRPKSQPQMVEAYTADGFPFQVSSTRQSHLEKNRVAAHKCRQRKKEYINGLEGRAREFSTKNKMLKENVAMLREQVLSLKNEVLRHAGCGFWAVDEYLARCAGDLLGMEAPGASTSRQNSSTQIPAVSTSALETHSRHMRAGTASTSDFDDFAGLELLKDFDDEDMDELDKVLE